MNKKHEIKQNIEKKKNFQTKQHVTVQLANENSNKADRFIYLFFASYEFERNRPLP